MIDFCIALFKKEQQEKTVKIYIAECLRCITENTAKNVQGSYITLKLDEILNPKPKKEQSADSVIDKIKKKLDKINS